MPVIKYKNVKLNKRANKRLDVDIKVQFYLWNPLFWKHSYSGSITNISQSYMYINAKTIDFPLDSLIEISIPNGEDVLYLSAKVSNIVWRNKLPNNSCGGIGIELTNPPKEYLKFIESLKINH